MVDAVDEKFAESRVEMWWKKGAGVVSVAPECRFELLPAAFALFWQN